MGIFIENGEPCEKMDFEKFQVRVMNVVRQKNDMDLIDSWEKHIVFKDFKKSQHSDFYATIYYADKDFNKNLVVRMYNFSYHNISGRYFFDCLNGTISNGEIQAMSRLANCFVRNKDRLIGRTLDDYWKRYHQTSREIGLEI